MKSLTQYILESQSFSVYILVGLPGSGKSTWIKENHPNIEILSKDNIRKELGIMDEDQIKKIGNKEQEKEVNKIYQERFLNLLEKEKDFAIDNTNIGTATKYILDNIKRHNKHHNNCKSIGVNIKTPKEVCMKRRENCIPEKVYNDMELGLKWLNSDDCDKIINVEYNEKNN